MSRLLCSPASRHTRYPNGDDQRCPSHLAAVSGLMRKPCPVKPHLEARERPGAIPVRSGRSSLLCTRCRKRCREEFDDLRHLLGVKLSRAGSEFGDVHRVVDAD